MGLQTNWGYSLTDAEALANMLEETEFDDLTAGKYSGDVRIASNIKAACSAIRNYCGWHVYPSLACTFTSYMVDKRVSRVGANLIIQLPAKYVSEVTAVRIGGTEYTTYILETNGILRIYAVGSYAEYVPIEIEYVAGLPDELMDGIKELIAHRVTHALASSAGVQSETAGGVSISYSANWINSARSTALADDNKEVLAPYRVQGVF